MTARWDLLLVGLAACHGAAVVTMPSVVLIALGVWWNSNTIAHNFIHRPFFKWRWMNILFSAYQSIVIGVPQTLWRDRHLAHHAEMAWRLRGSRRLIVETALVCGVWIALATQYPQFFATVYVPGYLTGMTLCVMQGHYEHAAGTISHYGRIYNLLCFNDGYHVEHHAYPGVHWTMLPRRVANDAVASRWPALLRWLEQIHGRRVLDALERVVLRWPRLQRFMLRVHRRAFRALLDDLPPLRRIAVVGGGLFPRTAIVLRDLVPTAEITIIDANRNHLDTARRLIDPQVRFLHGWFSPALTPLDVDLIVIPLAFDGDRAAIYRRPPAAAVLVHDWAWRRRGHGRLISPFLLKRLNLVRSA